MKQYQMKRQQANGFAMELTADGVWVKHADHIVEMAAAVRALAQAEAEVLALKSTINDIREPPIVMTMATTELREERDALKLKLETADALLREYKDALETIRDAVLNERGPMAESGMTSDQVNAVLGVLDNETPDAVRTDAHLNP